ncbi:hypothetical protein ACTA71_004769 [Dictyostelium dimigraforme]
MKYLFILFIFLLCILNINGQYACSFISSGNDYNIVLNVPPSFITQTLNTAYMTITLYTCSVISCGGYSETMVCGIYNGGSPFELGNYRNAASNITRDGVMVNYLSSPQPDYGCPSGFRTNIKYACNPSTQSVTKSINLIDNCNNMITFTSKDYCQTCSACVKSHGTCNIYSGWCTCDQYTTGLNCDQLKATITSVVAPTIDGGEVKILGDFSSIFPIGPNITIKIGTSICNQISFTGDTSLITCTVGAGQGYQNITLSDGKGASLLYQGFYYHYPCQANCSPYGTCNDLVGACVCNYNYAIGTDCKTLNIQLTTVIPTFLNGGQVYLQGDFSNAIGLTLDVKIGNLECTGITFDQTTLGCTIGSGEGIKDIVITSNSLTFSKVGAFEYQYYTCPLSCLHGTCNKYDGLCVCDNGTYGDQCQYIECPLNCSTPNGTCDRNTGICTCDNNHSGDSCDFILCPLNCSTPNGICDGKTGDCICDGKHSGDSCQFTECPFNCSTPNGTCDRNTGICTCDNKHSGDSCDFILCPSNCSAPNGTCDGKTGICNCNNPYTGETCDSIAKCTQECSPKHGICDSKTLGCICDTQTKGLSCEESRLFIESVDPTGLDGGTTTLIGYFGTPTSLLTIKIGDSQCINIKVINDTTLKCDIGPGEGSHNVTITDDDLSYTGVNKFQYVGQITKISKISGGTIAGIATGCIAGVSLLGAGGYYKYRQNKKVELFM